MDSREAEAAALKSVSPDSMDDEGKKALQSLVAEKGAGFVRHGSEWFIQTQELNPREIGPFDSDRSAKLFAGSNPDAKKATLRAIEE